MVSMTDAEKAAAHSKAHQKWILDTLKEKNGSCSYGNSRSWRGTSM